MQKLGRILWAPLAVVAALASPGLGASDAPFLWRIEGAVDHYLAGSVHVLPASAYPLPAALENAYAEASTLVLETDMVALNAPQAQLSMLASGVSEQGLAIEVGAKLHGRVRTALQEQGLPELLCDAFKAWLCAVTLSVQPFLAQGMDPSLGLDQHFATRAQADGKRQVALEAVQAQLDIISGMSPDLAKRFLQSAIEDLNDPELTPRSMIDSWQDNDVATLSRIVDDMREHYPMLYQRLLAQRNRAWMKPLRRQLSGSEPTLVVVGAAHLVGPDGLVMALQEAGFALSPVSH